MQEEPLLGLPFLYHEGEEEQGHRHIEYEEAHVDPIGQAGPVAGVPPVGLADPGQGQALQLPQLLQDHQPQVGVAPGGTAVRHLRTRGQTLTGRTASWFLWPEGGGQQGRP